MNTCIKSLYIGMLLSVTACQTSVPESVQVEPKPAITKVQDQAAVDNANSALPDTHVLRYNIAVKNQDVKDFFYGLMQMAKQNIVVHPSVNGKVSLLLQDVTLEEVLKAVSDIYGYDYDHNAYGYVVLPAILNTRVFAIDYLNVNRKGNSSTRVSSGQMVSTDNQSSSSGDSTSSTTNTVLDSTSIETRSGNDFWEELKVMLGLLVDTTKGGMVMVNPQSGLVVVRALPHELRSVDNFLKQAQLSLNREVVLEAKILEVTLHDRFQAGINWSALHQYHGSSSVESSLSSETLNNPDLIGGVFGMTITGNDFSGVIELLQTQGDVSVLSSPRVATTNNQKAAIKVGTNEFFVTDVKSTTTTSTAVTETPQVTLTPFFSGIVLDVTPQISEKGDVVLHVHPSVSEVTDQIKDIQIGTSDLSLPLALASVREADTVVRAKSNQIILIGGLMSENKSDVSGGVPWLGKIPVLGWLFKQQRKDHLKRELVILLRPTISDKPVADNLFANNWNSEKLQAVDAGFTDGPWLRFPSGTKTKKAVP